MKGWGVGGWGRGGFDENGAGRRKVEGRGQLIVINPFTPMMSLEKER